LWHLLKSIQYFGLLISDSSS